MSQYIHPRFVFILHNFPCTFPIIKFLISEEHRSLPF